MRGPTDRPRRILPTSRRRRALTSLAALFTAVSVVASCAADPPPPPSADPAETSAPIGPSTPPGTIAPIGSPGSTDPSTPRSPDPASPPVDLSPQAGLLLSEVRFAPVPGDAAFVEIANRSASAVDLHGASLSLDDALLSLGRLSDPLPAGGIALILLDGGSGGSTPEVASVEGSTLRASGGFSLAADSGEVRLLDRAGLQLDRVAWGEGSDTVALTNGTMIPESIEPGTSIGRAPGLLRPDEPLDWVVYQPAEVTQGTDNGLPAPSVLLPFDGALFEATPASLDWYPVPGAVSYRMQVQVEDTPSADPVMEVTVEAPSVPDVMGLGPGRYDWSVTAIAADGTESPASRRSAFEVTAAASAISLAALAPPTDPPGRQLSVGVLTQHKDSGMLLLERNVESGPHAWDVAHPRPDTTDPADTKNCALAAAAMVNAYFGGDLSQDRIGYELFKGRAPGPEQDLNWGYGITADQLTQALTFALGSAPTRQEPGMTPDDVWLAVTSSIDAGSPVVAAGQKHSIVFTGYSLLAGKRMLSYNDPWRGAGKLDIDFKAGALAAELDLWLPAAGSVGRKQEPAVVTDTDGDGVVDFDEVQRFGTDPSRVDTDGDGVGDRQDIVSGVFDPSYGYAVTGDIAGRDIDGDGQVTELDPDSDGGGCTDGEEDEDADGHRSGSETWNFDVSDDRCERSGAYGQVTYVYESVYDPGGDAEQSTSETLKIDVRLKDNADVEGVRAFEDDGSSFSYRMSGSGILRSELCDITTQSAASAGGLISSAGGRIVGGLPPPEDTFSLSASIPTENRGTIDYCVFIERQTIADAAQTPVSMECVAEVTEADARPRIYVYGCHESQDGYTWSMTGTITVP